MYLFLVLVYICSYIVSGCSGHRSDGSFRILHTIAGHTVCKDFFRRATGFDRRLFNSVYKEVMEGKVSLSAEDQALFSTRKDEERAMNICSFLDTYFQTEFGDIGNKP